MNTTKRIACIGEKEIPPHCFGEKRGMCLYNGHMSGDLRVRTYVPTTIFNPLAAVIRVYYVEDYSCQEPTAPELIVDIKRVPLHSFPKWDVGAQTLFLSRTDERAVIDACQQLEQKLLDAEDHLRERYKKQFSIE
ncbi:MAG TPA: hypothetical protein VJC21_03765 [Candidatus Nanoarchaeia archaeon]|nr:hypothetical protein [Candidatus Nanoarchaeia archaeon]